MYNTKNVPKKENGLQLCQLLQLCMHSNGLNTWFWEGFPGKIFGGRIRNYVF